MSKIRHEPAAGTATRSLLGGSRIDPHRHDEHQIVYASRGALSVTTATGVWVAPANRAIWVPAGAVHEHRACGPTVLHTVGLPVTVNPLRVDEPTVIAVSPLLRELFIAYSARAATHHPALAERGRMQAVLIDQLHASPERPLHIPIPRDGRLAEVGALLRSGENVPLQRLAAEVGSSARTISRLCREELGMSFPQWRTQLRLYRALELLAEGCAVTTVAHRCGWSTPSAFIEVFHRTMGYTPGGRQKT